MKKTHFPITYFGNKREEVDKIYNQIKDSLQNIKYIVEPFCGSSALSYYISLQMPNKFIYILNDNNSFLCELYQTLKDENKTDKMISKLNIIHKKVKTKEDYDKIDMNLNMYNWVYKNKIFKIRPNLFPSTKTFSKDVFNNFRNYGIINFLRNEKCIISNNDAIDIYNKFKSDKNTLIFLDPPYMDTDNSFYLNPLMNIYDFLSKNDIDKEKAKIILCLKDNIFLRTLFKNKKIITYDKTYRTTKKQLKHILFMNKNL